MALTDADIAGILMKQSYISEAEQKDALTEAKKREVPVLSLLFERGLLTQDLYESAMAELSLIHI